jgi:hypothetical protein
MKRIIIYFSLLLAPFLLVVCVNELNRPSPLNTLTLFGQKSVSMNPSSCMKDRCTWFCHNHGCGKLNGPNRCPHQQKNTINKGFVARIYWSILQVNGISNGVNNTYQSNSVLSLVILWPLLLLGLVIFNVELFLSRKKKNG